MIVITGAAGFMGSNILAKLNYEGYRDIILVDDFSQEDKYPNFKGKAYSGTVDRLNLPDWLDTNHTQVQFVIHMAAQPNDAQQQNLKYSQTIWIKCVDYGLPFIYASTAATYGDGELGFDDNEQILPKLKPMNKFGAMNHMFDSWVLKQTRKPYFWAGLKLFSVYGPNENHKGAMASVVYRAYDQIRDAGHIKLYKSYKEGIANGQQTRDFVYVKDVAEVLLFLMEQRQHSGIYNVGTGTARSYIDMATTTFQAMGIHKNIVFGAMPKDMRETYQYHTEANISKLRRIGYRKPFTQIEEGVKEYLQQYLLYSKRN